MQSKRNRLTRKQENSIPTLSVGLSFLWTPMLTLALSLKMMEVFVGLILVLVILATLIRLSLTWEQSAGNRTIGTGNASMENSSRSLQNSPIVHWNHLEM